ncbi:MAG: hypothetical protein AAGC55_04040 [Myxococcota bacterium]
MSCALALASCSRMGEYVDEVTEEDDHGDRSDCNEQYTRCLGTRLADHKGSVRGESRCQTCRQLCRRDGYWPTRVQGWDCQWWHYK